MVSFTVDSGLELIDVLMIFSTLTLSPFSLKDKHKANLGVDTDCRALPCLELSSEPPAEQLQDCTRQVFSCFPKPTQQESSFSYPAYLNSAVAYGLHLWGVRGRIHLVPTIPTLPKFQSSFRNCTH